MKKNDWFTVAITVISTVLGAVAIIVPLLWSLSTDVGNIKGDIGGLRARTDEVARLLDGIDRKLASVVEKLDTIDRRTDGIERRLADRETDPSTFLAKAGLTKDQFAATWVGDKLYVFPRTSEASALIAKSGMQQESVSPGIFGYPLAEREPSTGIWKPLLGQP